MSNLQRSPKMAGHCILFLHFFKPLGFWIIEDVSIVNKNGVLKSRKCRRPDILNSGSKDIPFGQNRVNELIEAIYNATGA